VKKLVIICICMFVSCMSMLGRSDENNLKKNLKSDETILPTKITIDKAVYDKLYKYTKIYFQLRKIEIDKSMEIRTKKAYHAGNGIYVIPLKIEWVSKDKVLLKQVIINVHFPIIEVQDNI